MRRAMSALAAVLVAGTAHAQSLNPAVTPETIASTICVKGWTASVRPPYHETQVIKRDLLRAQGLDWSHAPEFQLDHTMPICLGGHPSDPANFQLQPIEEAYRKDRIEWKACCLVCSGQITLADAQAAMVDWQAAYHKYAKLKCRRP